MITFGIMSLNLESESAYIDEIAARADACGIICYRFVPTGINPQTLTVQGKKFDMISHQWVDDEFHMPHLLYDRCFYGDDDHSKLCIPIVSWLKSREDITFLGYGLPDKLALYNSLQNTILSPYLPPSQLIQNSQDLIDALNKQKKLIIKPLTGSQGYGVYYLKKNSKTIHVKTEKNKNIISRIFPNENKLHNWLQPLITKRAFLLQPYLELSNESSQPFDIRIFLQKNENGGWTERGRGIRLGNKGGILSNLSAGGRVIDFHQGSSTCFSVNKKLINEELDFVLSHLPHQLEKSFSPLFELGVDIGVSKSGAIWILDVNSKPGRKVLLETQPNLYEALYLAPLLYGKYLLLNNLKERKIYYETTLFD